MAFVHLLRQSVEVCTREANGKCGASSGVLSLCKQTHCLSCNPLIVLQLPDSIKDFYRNLFGATPSADVLAHLKRELMHRIWDMLLTPEFIHAYVHGIVIKCYDGIERRIFPRFFTYGADYPEKFIFLSSIACVF